MRFWKYQGTGNDFIIIDGTDGRTVIDKDRCRSMCDRHYGIGADGVLYIMPGENSDITMRIINADGSEAEMCGNGIRCVAKHAYEHGLVKKDTFCIHTLSGNKKAELVLKDGEAESVRIDMGAPVLDGRAVPIDCDGRFVNRPFDVGGRKLIGTAVSMGNPHFVTFTDLSDRDVSELGPVLESHPFFPRRTNVEFCRVKDGRIDITVYERGAAWTLACGTGACASTVAAALNGYVPYGEPVDVHLPGGWLRITVDRDLGHVLMEGPAKLVFEGNME